MASTEDTRVRAFVGTSGFAYKEWKGHFYPDNLAADDMLAYYAQRFNAVEINNTFYRMPRESVVRHWGSQAPDGFSFVLKASRRITHLKRLRDVGDELNYFLGAAAALKGKLGPILFQLPPNFKKDTSRLHEFLRQIPKRYRVALEVRHASWFADDVYEVLGSRGAALVVADADDDEPAVVPTAEWGYLRLRREAYGEPELEAWASRIREAWPEAFVFFKHEDEGVGPALGLRFAEMLVADEE